MGRAELRLTTKTVQTLFILSDGSESSRVETKKRTRTIFTEEQLQKLEAHFEKQQYIVGENRVQLAKELNLTELQVSQGDAAQGAQLGDLWLQDECHSAGQRPKSTLTFNQREAVCLVCML